jgi:XRE family aerobic/anaerobic benzoate catabolism transcriptional regulator
MGKQSTKTILAPKTPDRRKESDSGKEPLLVALGERLKMLRARKAMPRRALAEAAGVSERHLANLETGTGNASLLVLRQVAQALDCTIAELIGDETTKSPEGLLLRQLLRYRTQDELARARRVLMEMFGEALPPEKRADRIALIGLRGAGKTTLGRMLAEDLDRPFIELGREITRLAGCGPAEIEALYGTSAYRRYERRALEEALQLHPKSVIATGGGLVTDPASFNLVLTHAYTVWLQASPEEHMNRVIAQGDLRPMSGSEEAMEDLKTILATRGPFYAKADLTFDTSGKSAGQAYAGLKTALKRVAA